MDSTALSARLDQEDLRDLLATYQRHATAVVEAAGGRVARYEGDGILAYFGYPDRALATAARTGERRADAALHRLRGELLLAVGKRSEHELQKALGVTRSQQARAEETRAVEAIARLAGGQP